MITMKFFIVDDSATIRGMLSNIIEEEGLGVIAGEREDGSEVYADHLAVQEIDILIIDLLMPNRDGIETIREIAPSFNGKIIMISQVESKDMISEAYSLGIEHFITKPINRLEVVSIIKLVCDHLLLERSLRHIQNSLRFLESHTKNELPKNESQGSSIPIITSGKSILLELGIIGDNGAKDLLDLLLILSKLEEEGIREIPPFKELYRMVIEKRLGTIVCPQELTKEIRTGEQRVRRTIHQTLEHLASLGLTDYTNPIFENYSAKLFDYGQVRLKMLELEGKKHQDNSRINIRRFIRALFMEAKKEV